MKGSSKGAFSQWAELGAVYPALVHWKDKWPDVRFFTDSWDIANGLAGWSRTRKEYDWEIGEKDIWRRNM